MCLAFKTFFSFFFQTAARTVSFPFSMAFQQLDGHLSNSGGHRYQLSVDQLAA